MACDKKECKKECKKEECKPAAAPVTTPVAPATPAPAVVAPAVAPKPEKKKADYRVMTARVTGAAVAGLAEIFTFHPVDTIAKRLMANQKKVFGGGMKKSMDNVSRVIFKNAYEKGTFAKYLSLFPGIGFGVAYKLLQRVYKFGGQPFVDDYITKNHKKFFDATFSPKWAKSIMYATAGSLIGIGEVVLLPLDVLKIKSQTNPEALAGKGLVELIVKENVKLYRGTLFTMARNAPGSFALFGGNAFAKEYIFKLKDYKKATFLQTSVASTVGATASILVSSPFDVVKTRIQKQGFKEGKTGLQILSEMTFREGPQSYFKGVIPKVGIIGPKLIFSFTIAQLLTTKIETALGVKPSGGFHKKH